MSKFPSVQIRVKQENFRRMHEGSYWTQLYDFTCNSTHTIPLNDLKDHDGNHKCWCNPEYIPHRGIWMHTSADNRESYEDGRLLQ